VETPIGTNIVLLKDSVNVTVSDHLHIKPLSSTTTEIEIVKAKLEDEGEYSIVIDNKEQPLMKLEVTPKPVVRQEMQLPKTQFNEKETLTIVCQFDARPEEAFIFLHNDQPIVPDSHITTTVEDNKYTIEVKDLRPEHEGVYTLKSDHLILDTPSITVVPEEKKPQTETTTVEEEEIVTVVTQQEQPETIVQKIEEITQIIEEEKVGLFVQYRSKCRQP
jgi:hypothetical protein